MAKITEKSTKQDILEAYHKVLSDMVRKSKLIFVLYVESN